MYELLAFISCSYLPGVHREDILLEVSPVASVLLTRLLVLLILRLLIWLIAARCLLITALLISMLLIALLIVRHFCFFSHRNRPFEITKSVGFVLRSRSCTNLDICNPMTLQRGQGLCLTFESRQQLLGKPCSWFVMVLGVMPLLFTSGGMGGSYRSFINWTPPPFNTMKTDILGFQDKQLNHMFYRNRR